MEELGVRLFFQDKRNCLEHRLIYSGCALAPAHYQNDGSVRFQTQRHASSARIPTLELRTHRCSSDAHGAVWKLMRRGSKSNKNMIDPASEQSVCSAGIA